MHAVGIQQCVSDTVCVRLAMQNASHEGTAKRNSRAARRQVEGMIADRNLCLGDLIGVIRTFFHKIGITQVFVAVLCAKERA